MSLSQLQKDLGAVLWGKAGFNSLQTAQQWKAYLSSREGLPLAGVQWQQLALYESLLKNTVEETLGTLFPFCKGILGAQWSSLTEQYRRYYPNRSFLLYQCAKDFPEFISTQEDICVELPFLPELALFEWLEVEVENAPHPSLPVSFQNAIPTTPLELAGYCPVWNPDADLRAWQYHIPSVVELLIQNEKLSAASKMALGQGLIQAQSTTLLIYRDFNTHQARFFEINTLTAMLIHLSSNNELSYHDLFCHLKETIPDVPMGILLEQGLSLVDQCYQENIILGSKPYSSEKRLR